MHRFPTKHFVIYPHHQVS